jgi:hypothetical protein
MSASNTYTKERVLSVALESHDKDLIISIAKATDKTTSSVLRNLIETSLKGIKGVKIHE